MNTRHGFTLMEALVSCLLLAVLTTLCLQLVGTSATQRKAASLREIALQGAANTMERLAAIKWEDLTPEAVGKSAPLRETAEGLPGGSVTVDVLPLPDEPSAKRISVEVRWEPAQDKPAQHVRLVALRYSVDKEPEASR